MAQSHASNPQLSKDKLAKEIGDIYSKHISLLSLCKQVDPSLVHDGKVVSVSTRIDTALEIAEGDPVGNTDMTLALAAMAETKSRNSVLLSDEILEDSMESFRLSLLEEVVQSHQRYSDNYILGVAGSSVTIPSTQVASMAALTLSDLHAACVAVSYSGSLPDLFCSQSTYFAFKDLELASGVLSEAGSVCGLRWVPTDAPASASGDVVALVGDPSRHFVVADNGLQVMLDDQSSTVNSLSDQSVLYSRQRFSLGEYAGAGSGLAKIRIA